MKKKIGPKKVVKTSADAKPKKKKEQKVTEFRVKDVMRRYKPQHVEKAEQRFKKVKQKDDETPAKKKKATVPRKAQEALEKMVPRKTAKDKKVARLLEAKPPKLAAESVDLPAKDKKRMTKVSAQLAVLGDVTPKQIQQSLSDNFGAAAPKIIDMLEMNDNDGAMILLQKRLLQSSIAMLTYAEHLMRDTEGAKGTYQYATLVSQIRELITDIQANRDRSFIANSIIDQNIRPAFIDLAEIIINDHQAFRKEMQEGGIVKSDKFPEFNTALRDLAKNLAIKMNSKYKDLSHNITVQLTS